MLSVSSGSPIPKKRTTVRKYAAVRDIRGVAAGRELDLKATRKLGSVTNLQANTSTELLPKKKLQSKSVTKTGNPGAYAAQQRINQRV